MTAPTRRRFRSTTCRINYQSTRPHPCSPSHVDTVEGYRLWRESEWERMEQETAEWPTEMDEYWLSNPRPTFGRYLRDMRQER